MLRTEAVKQLLQFSPNDIAKAYHYGMELQVNVAQDHGVKIGGEFKGKKWRGWKDPDTGEIWKSFRVPWSANIEPHYKDTKMKFNLAEHVEGIGLTGWNWQEQKSIFVGYDFDSIVNHESGISPEKLEELKEKTAELPWVKLIRSTSGKGYHLYIFFENPPKTKTHNEHSALARSLLGVLTSEIGFDFKANVDCVGMVLWVYHRKQEGTNGFETIKENSSKLPTEKIPKNWIDHLQVVSGSKKRVQSITGRLSLPEAIKNFYLKEDHQRILKWFSTSAKMDWWWDMDNTMLVCHTYDLKQCDTDLQLKGVFETISEGTDPTQNCFAFPLTNGGFIIRRFGQKTKEALTWYTDENGWTKTYFNMKPDLPSVAKFHDAKEDENGEWVFQSLQVSKEALSKMDIVMNYPSGSVERVVRIKSKNNKLIIKFDKFDGDVNFPQFLAKKKMWIRVEKLYTNTEVISKTPDELIRHTIAEGKEAGWYVNIAEAWVLQPKSNITLVVQAEMPHLTKQEIEQKMGKTILQPWSIVNRPFEDEYPGDRQWNKDGAELAITPKQGSYPTWEKMLKHLGNGLDRPVQENEWCKENNIQSGAEYLFLWIAWMFQKPFQSLPYLFFVGEQKTGKSTFHESLYYLFKGGKGYTRADQALKGDYNAVLAHAVLCVIEEVNLSDNKTALNKAKDWITGQTISINEKYKNSFTVDNSTHWVQMANDATYFPLFSGDTRVVMIEVSQIEKEIAPAIFLESIQNESSAFLFDVLNYDLPDPCGRLAIPVLGTEIREDVIQDNYNLLEAFVSEKLYTKHGSMLSIEEIFQSFKAWLAQNAPSQIEKWNQRKLARKFPKKSPFIKGKWGTENKTYIGNISFDKDVPKKKALQLTEKGRLDYEDNTSRNRL